MNKIDKLRARQNELVQIISEDLLNEDVLTQTVIEKVRECKNINGKIRKVEKALSVLAEFENDEE